MTHPSTCQCGGSGKIGVHPIYPLKMINECPGMNSEGWDAFLKEARKFKRICCSGCMEEECEGVVQKESINVALQAAVDAALSSHSQALQERHEGEIKRRRDAIEACVDSCGEHLDGKFYEDCDDCHQRLTIINSALTAFDHATHLNPKS